MTKTRFGEHCKPVTQQVRAEAIRNGAKHIPSAMGAHVHDKHNDDFEKLAIGVVARCKNAAHREAVEANYVNMFECELNRRDEGVNAIL